MPPLESISENLRFMVHEVNTQVAQTRQFLDRPNRAMVEKIRSRDDYIDTLKSMIQEKTFEILISSSRLDKNDVNFLRAVTIISANLERIADFSVNMLRQAEHLTDIEFFSRFDYQSCFDEVLWGLSRVQPCLDKRDIGLAFRICQCEFTLDEMYGNQFKNILAGLQADGETGNLVTALMMFHYLERMGDSLLNIGEALLYSLVGENLKIQQYRGLRDSLDASGLDMPISQVEFESIWGTRSGCRIGLVGEAAKDEASRPVLFKHGSFKKLSKEKENIERWDSVFPGLPPKVRGFASGDEEDGSILLEFLPGCTFQELLLNGEKSLAQDALFMIEETVNQAWAETITRTPAQAGFIQQMYDRMEAVFRLHPEFAVAEKRIGSLVIPSLMNCLAVLKQSEADLSCPFSVMIHGDFNINNIIYDNHRERIHFIDLHRSGQADYIQDVSVFLISCFRLPVFDFPVRSLLNWAIMDFYEFARNFALEMGDDTFEARLTFGLARSFFSSTRFELNHRFAKKMFLISRYLLDSLQQHGDRPWNTFELPGEILVYA